MSALGIFVHFGLAGHLGLIAYERFIFFCKPMIYEHHLTTTRVIVASAAIYFMSAVFVIATELTLGRFYHPAVMAFNLEASGLQSIIQFCLFFLTPLIITIFCAVKIWRLIKSSSVAPAVPSGQQSALSPTVIKKATWALRMILLIGSTLWFSNIPGFVIRGVLFNIGYTWEDMDTRRHLIPAILMRFALYLYCALPLALNPIIYYGTQPDLWKSFRRLISHKNVVEPMP